MIMQAMDRMRKIQIGRLYPALSPSEIHLLSIVIDSTEGLTVSAISERMDAPMSAVSRMMRSMEERSLIERKIMPQDRRSILVTITPEGRKACDELYECLHGFFAELIEVFEPDEFDVIMEHLHILMDRMELVLNRRLEGGRTPVHRSSCGNPATEEGTVQNPAGPERLCAAPEDADMKKQEKNKNMEIRKEAE